jgi:hypothetical protein
VQAEEAALAEEVEGREAAAQQQQQPAEPEALADPWGPVQGFKITGEVVSGGDWPTLSSSDGRCLTCHSIKTLLPCDAQPHCCIPRVHIPGALWGDVVEVGVGWEVVDGAWLFSSRLLQHFEAGADADSDLTACSEAQHVLKAALESW